MFTVIIIFEIKNIEKHLHCFIIVNYSGKLFYKVTNYIQFAQFNQVSIVCVVVDLFVFEIWFGKFNVL